MQDQVICLSCGGVLEPLPGTQVRACQCTPVLTEGKSVRCPSCGGSIKVGTRACPYCASGWFDAGADEIDSTARWNTGNNVFADLLQSIVRAWR